MGGAGGDPVPDEFPPSLRVRARDMEVHSPALKAHPPSFLRGGDSGARNDSAGGARRPMRSARGVQPLGVLQRSRMPSATADRLQAGARVCVLLATAWG